MDSTITLNISLDDNRVPESITWAAPEGGVDQAAADAFMLTVWDGKGKEALRIDLWTKDMLVDDMKKFYHQTLLAMADGFHGPPTKRLWPKTCGTLHATLQRSRN